jgi:hypothetical protein
MTHGWASPTPTIVIVAAILVVLPGRLLVLQVMSGFPLLAKTHRMLASRHVVWLEKAAQSGNGNLGGNRTPPPLCRECHDVQSNCGTKSALAETSG